MDLAQGCPTTSRAILTTIPCSLKNSHDGTGTVGEAAKRRNISTASSASVRRAGSPTGFLPSCPTCFPRCSPDPADIRRSGWDPANVGFITEGPEAVRAGFRVDTSVPGNGNGGHRYGTGLGAAQKEDLLEYLKTL